MVRYSSVPEELQKRTIWGLFTTEVKPTKTDPNHLTKMPISPVDASGLPSNDSSKWFDFETALNALNEMKFNSKGLAMLIQPPYMFIDLDHKENEMNNGTGMVAEFLTAANHSYAETSVSGTGLHIIARGEKHTTRSKNSKFGLEMYTDARFVALTGDSFNGVSTINEVNQDYLDKLTAKYFPEKTPVSNISTVSIGSELPDDAVLLDKAFNAKNGAAFKELYQGNWEKNYSSQSEADQALANYLAFWSNKDYSQMNRLFRQSSLMRDKWDEKHGKQTYAAITLNTAMRDVSDTYSKRPLTSNSYSNISELLSNEASSNLKPFDVYKYPLPKKRDEDSIKEYNAELKGKLPSWLTVYFKTLTRDEDDPDKSEITRVVQIDVLDYSYHLLDHNKIETFPALTEGAIYETNKGTWRTLGKGGFVQTIETRTTKEMLKWGIYQDSKIINVRKFLRRYSYNESYGKHSPFDENKHPELVAFSNGTYNILTNEMQPSSPDNYMMNAHDYEVDPNKTDCSETEKLITKMIGVEPMILFEEFCGYMFYRSHVPFQEFLWLRGFGGEAKSGLLRRIQNMLGRDNFTAIKPAVLADPNRRFDTASLYGAEANIVADVGTDYLKGTDMIKSLTGGDVIPAEYKGLQNFTFTNYAKQLYSANALPTFSDSTDGFKDRVTVIPLINGHIRGTNWWDQFDEDLIDEEVPAFAMHCMQLFKLAIDRGSLTKPQSVKLASQAWLDENDHFKQFLEEHCTLNTKEINGEAVTDVVAEYKAFCNLNNYSDRTSSQSITKRLNEFGIYPEKTTRGINGNHNNLKRYIGLQLNDTLL